MKFWKWFKKKGKKIDKQHREEIEFLKKLEKKFKILEKEVRRKKK